MQKKVKCFSGPNTAQTQLNTWSYNDKVTKNPLKLYPFWKMQIKLKKKVFMWLQYTPPLFPFVKCNENSVIRNKTFFFRLVEASTENFCYHATRIDAVFRPLFGLHLVYQNQI